ncbi:phage gp6-like head-tail connector protein [Brevundimonas sp. WCHBH090558]|uniref:head-tail connector protein n=1 Tax=Brevundimonas huaxiensis TaxID=2725493 RepID=UPI0016278434|nr:head-tail connector protein [Brevundimonas huaxiensis]MBC1183744.1 phage gp6-like head-tail connector protein [Brevundimonas huaxiensis]
MVEPIITLAEAKAFLRLDYDDEDELIAQLILTASETALAHADGLTPGDAIPESVRTAALIHVARLFDTRHSEDQPAASLTLANRYRRWDV